MELSLTAFFLGLLHTVMGPDHYLPLAGVARTRRWSTSKTLGLTAAFGVFHIGTAILIGLGLAKAGLSLNLLQRMDLIRSQLLGGLLIAVGLILFIRALKSPARKHWTSTASTHFLLIVFLVGPCEPLIPLLLIPLSQGASWAAIGIPLLSYSVATVLMMAVLVTATLQPLTFSAWRKSPLLLPRVTALLVMVSGCAVLLGA